MAQVTRKLTRVTHAAMKPSVKSFGIVAVRESDKHAIDCGNATRRKAHVSERLLDESPAISGSVEVDDEGAQAATSMAERPGFSTPARDGSVTLRFELF